MKRSSTGGDGRSWPPPEVRITSGESLSERGVWTGGAFRAELTATDEITGRMGRDHYRGQRIIWWVLAPAFLAVAPLWAIYDWLFRDGAVDPWLLLTGLIVNSIILLFFWLGLLFSGGPHAFRLEIPAGTVIVAELSDRWISLRHTSFNGVASADVDEIRLVGQSVLVRGAGLDLTIPAMLLPPDAVAELTRRFARGRRPVVAAPGREFPVPELPDPAAGEPGADRVVAVVADDAAAERMITATRLSPAVRWFLLAIPLPLVAIGEYALRGTLTTADLVMGLLMVGAFYGIALYFLFGRVPRFYRRFTGPGMPLAARYSPEWLTIRFGGYVHGVPIGQIRSARLVGGVWLLGRGLGRTGLAVPAELVRPAVAAEWSALRRRS